jgi:hypothetical protein
MGTFIALPPAYACSIVFLCLILSFYAKNQSVLFCGFQLILKYLGLSIGKFHYLYSTVWIKQCIHSVDVHFVPL